MNHPTVVDFAQAVDQVLNSRTFVLSCAKSQDQDDSGVLGLERFLASSRLDQALLEQDLLLQDGDFFHEWREGQWIPRWTSFERGQTPSIELLPEGVAYLMGMLSKQTPQHFHSPYQCELTEKHAKEVIYRFMNHITEGAPFQIYTIETCYLFSTPNGADYWDGMGLDSLTAIESQTQWTLIITNGCA